MEKSDTYRVCRKRSYPKAANTAAVFYEIYALGVEFAGGTVNVIIHPRRRCENAIDQRQNQ